MLSYIFNPLSKLGLTASVPIKGVVSTTADLPLVGNAENDCYIVKADDYIYTWNSTSPTGTLADWKVVGVVATSWDTLTGKPSSEPAAIDDAVSKKHSQVELQTEYDNSNSGASKEINWASAIKQKVTLSANCSLTFGNPSGAVNLILKIVQDDTGSRTIDWSGINIKWQGGSEPTLSTAAGAIDILALYFDGTTYYGQLGGFA